MDEKEFIVKMYHYIDGELKLLIKEFDKVEEAIEHGISEACHSFKVLDRDGCLHHDSHDHYHGEGYCY